MPFSEESFYEIYLICSLLQNNYFVKNNKTAGLHAQISGGLQEIK